MSWGDEEMKETQYTAMRHTAETTQCVGNLILLIYEISYYYTLTD